MKKLLLLIAAFITLESSAKSIERKIDQGIYDVFNPHNKPNPKPVTIPAGGLSSLGIDPATINSSVECGHYGSSFEWRPAAGYDENFRTKDSVSFFCYCRPPLARLQNRNNGPYSCERTDCKNNEFSFKRVCMKCPFTAFAEPQVRNPLTNHCTVCPKGAKNIDSVCVCSEGFVFNPKTWTCDTCPANQIVFEGLCRACPANAPKKGNTCVCPTNTAGLQLISGGHLDWAVRPPDVLQCPTCAPHEIWKDNRCVACDRDSIASFNHKECQKISSTARSPFFKNMQNMLIKQQVPALTPDDLKTMIESLVSAQMKALKQTQINTLTPTQINALTQNQILTMLLALQSLPAESQTAIMKKLSPEQITAIQKSVQKFSS